jgi:hypothetical protein
LVSKNSKKKGKEMKKTLFTACAILLMLGGMVANASIISKFNVDNENWTVSGLATLSHEKKGGNHGGFLVAAEAGGDTFEVVAPLKFFGDLSAYKGGTLSFDSKLITASSQTFGSGFGKVTILGGGASAELDLAPNPPETDWVTYSALLVASSWGVNETTWDQILANVTEIRVILESVVGWETMGFDNFKVQPVKGHPAPVPEPATMLLLGIGLVGLIGYSRKKFNK